MNTDHFKQKLLAKEQELVSEISRLSGEMRTEGEPEVGDPIDHVTNASNAAALSQMAVLESQTLTAVRDALARIDDGSYGKCVLCDRDIEAARLEAIPWTPYCLEDQEKQDKQKAEGAADEWPAS